MARQNFFFFSFRLPITGVGDGTHERNHSPILVIGNKVHARWESHLYTVQLAQQCILFSCFLHAFRL